jgi:hydrogenase maturation factor HypE
MIKYAEGNVTTYAFAILVALLEGGAVFFLFGVAAYDVSSPNITQILSGSALDNAGLMVLGGITMSIVGVIGLVRISKTARRWS